MAKKFEYKVIAWSGLDLILTEEILNSYGKESWELVSTDGRMLIFKREI